MYDFKDFVSGKIAAKVFDDSGADALYALCVSYNLMLENGIPISKIGKHYFHQKYNEFGCQNGNGVVSRSSGGWFSNNGRDVLCVPELFLESEIATANLNIEDCILF